MNKALPKVSVVTITYGHEKYITETLDGVLMQQYQGPVELIIANDNSPDATDEVVKKYFSENPAPENFEIKYTKHETNKGMMPNFIWALEQATGEYIALCEGDDYWTDPQKLQKQVDFLEENKEYIAVGHQRIVVENDIEKNYFSQDILYTQCVLFKNIINEDYIKFSDGVFNGDTFLFNYLKLFGKVKNLDFVGAVYRMTGFGVYSSIDEINKINKALETYSTLISLQGKFKTKNSRNVFRQIKFSYADNLYAKALYLIPTDKSLALKQFYQFIIFIIQNNLFFKKQFVKSAINFMTRIFSKIKNEAV